MTADPAYVLLERCLREAERPSLLLIDENIDAEQLPCPPPHSDLSLLTNRWDIFQALRHNGYAVGFNDFTFDEYPTNRFRSVTYRISKEKAVVHHIINQCARVLEPGGKLHLIGHKREGLLSYQRRAAEHLNGDCASHRTSAGYRAVEITRNRELGHSLDDANYSNLRACIEAGDVRLYSKPGIYGWNKIDRGSQLLMDTFEQATSGDQSQTAASILDLGCGYGYLSARAAQTFNATIWATDNNCAALMACARNFSELGIKGKVVADDCAQHIQAKFDYVLCNPPFHRGFDTNRQITELFLQQAASHLQQNGLAWFVVNQFIGLEAAAKRYFRRSEEIERQDGFKVIRFAL